MKDVQEKIKEAIGEFGENVITESRLVYILDDSGVLRELKAEKRILRTIIEEGYTESILTHSKERDLHLKICSYISEINKNHGFEVEKLKTVFSWISDGLGIPPVPYSTLKVGDKEEIDNNSLLPPPIPIEIPPVISNKNPVESEVPPEPIKQQDKKQTEPQKPEPKKPKKKPKKGYSWVSSIIFLLVAFGLRYFLNLKKSEKAPSNNNEVALLSKNEENKTDNIATGNNTSINQIDIDTTSFYEDTLYVDEEIMEEETNLYGNAYEDIPSWIIGKWKCDAQNKTHTMVINHDGTGRINFAYGSFTYSQGNLYFYSSDGSPDSGSSILEVDEANLRLVANNRYYHKVISDDIATTNQSTNQSNSSTATISTKKISIVGTINKDYPITMELVQNSDGGMNGFYYYNKNGPEHRLSVYGQLDGSRFRLQEYDNNDNNTGNFVGTYHNGKVSGTFSLPDGKTMSFDLEVVN